MLGLMLCNNKLSLFSNFISSLPLEKVNSGQCSEGKQKKFKNLTVNVRKHEHKIQFEILRYKISQTK